MQLPGKTFLVTGGASGLGAATAHGLVAAGAQVVVGDLRAEAAVGVAESLGSNAIACGLDVTSPESVAVAIELARTRWGALHGAVNCAGILGGSRVVGRDGPHDLALFRRIVDVNLVGTFNVCRLVAEAAAKNEPDDQGERGVLVNVSSVSAFEGQIGQAAYAASKGGVASLTLPMARELARLGIRVVAIAPGVFGTPMIDALAGALQESLASQAVFPPRLGRPEEFASFVRHVLENPMLNGAVLRLDGGVRLAAK